MPDLQTPAHHAIGDTTITLLSDGYFTMPVAQFVRDAPSAQLNEILTIDVNAFLIRHKDSAPILIDAGLGRGFMDTLGDLPETLAALGIAPSAIGTVLITHLHADHCGGLVDLSGNALFPNADIVVHRDELEHWIDGPAPGGADAQGAQVAARALSPYAGRVRSFSTTDPVAPGIVPVPLPGHTPGHTGYRIGDGKQSVLIWGDLVNVPDLQLRQPNTGVMTDVDTELANATRRATLARLVEDRGIVAGMHTNAAGFFTVERAEDGYRLAPAM